MKKIYASVLALGVVFSANAQVAQQKAQHIKTNDYTAAFEQPVTAPSVAATGDTINSLYFDFSTTANWTLGNLDGATGSWVVGTAVPSGDFPIDPILSSTAANGYALYDSDLLCGTDNAYIQLANPVDLTGQGSVAVQFQQFYRNFQGQTFLDVSVDGTTWTEYEVNAALAVNDATANPAITQVNISGVAANAAQVWIRFRIVGGCDYAWMVDDVAFVEGAQNDLQIVDVWHGDIIEAFEYQQIPLAQAAEVVIGAASLNSGGADQTNVVYSYDIFEGSTSVASGTFAANTTTLVPTVYDTTWYATGFTPSVVGNYTVTVTVAADEVDETPANNELSSMFKITESIYAHDDEDNIEFQVVGRDADGNVPEFKMAMYYEMKANATLTSVEVAFGGLTRASSCIIEVFDVVNDQSLASPIATEVYDIMAADIPTAGEVIPVNIPIEDGDGIQLAADGLYLISISNASVGDSLYILASAGDADRAQLRYGPFGVGGAINWYTGYTTSPVIRANFDASIGIEENEDVAGFSVYPNPTSDNLNINFVSKENQNVTLNVISVDGALVYSKNLNTKVGQTTKTSVDFAELSKGIYMVQLVGTSSSITQRVVVQ